MITELITFKLVDESTFNPIALLQLLQQLCTTYAHQSKCKYKAYQEKEVSSRFYLIGGWWSTDAQSEFQMTDVYRNLMQLVSGTFELVSSTLVTCDATQITALHGPILSVERHTFRGRTEFDEIAADLLKVHQDVTVNQSAGGYVIGDPSYLLVSGWKSIKEHTSVLATGGDFDRLETAARERTTGLEIRHIEINQFI